ncbi:hypothetical protein EDB87DRAFT_291547 [Lactarius vividus]|nr:hypothetical protein EDB87DRAFT_291547 [Lactarius vividus]
MKFTSDTVYVPSITHTLHCYDPFRHTLSRQALRSPDLCVFKVQTVIENEKNSVSSSLAPFIGRICLPYCLIGRNRADGMEDANVNVNVKTIVTCPAFSIPLPLPTFYSKGKGGLTLGILVFPCDCYFFPPPAWVNHLGRWHMHACVIILLSPHPPFQRLAGSDSNAKSVSKLGQTDGWRFTCTAHSCHPFRQDSYRERAPARSTPCRCMKCTRLERVASVLLVLPPTARLACAACLKGMDVLLGGDRSKPPHLTPL